MTCKIDWIVGDDGITVLRIAGHVEVDYVNKIEEMIARQNGPIALDLKELTLVDRDAVTYLSSWKRKGIEFRNCPPVLTEWISNV